MTGWNICELESICSRLSSGKSISAKLISGKGNYPVYGGNGVRGYTSISNFKGDCAIIGRQGAYCGNVRYFKGEAYMTEHAVVVCANEDNCTRYIAYLLGTMNLGELSGQSAQPGLSVKALGKQEIRIPPKDVQMKCADLLGVFDEKIRCNMEINDNLLQQAQAILTSFFIDFSRFDGTIPADWEQGTLQDIADFSNGYAFKSKELLDIPESDCYQVFKQGHINRGGGFNSSGTKSWYPISKCTHLSKYVLHKGDVLMAMTDMKDNVAILGNTALMTLDNQYIVNQRVGLLRSNGYKGTSYAYIYLLTNSFDFLKDLRSRANSGVQVNLSANEIKSSPC